MWVRGGVGTWTSVLADRCVNFQNRISQQIGVIAEFLLEQGGDLCAREGAPARVGFNSCKKLQYHVT